jgi:hypothetical protein
MTDSLQERVIGKTEVIDRVPDFEAQQIELRDPEAASGKLVGAVPRFPASAMVWSQAGDDWFLVRVGFRAGITRWEGAGGRHRRLKRLREPSFQKFAQLGRRLELGNGI